ncbi:MAG: hypothetical protein JWO38_6675 [Gemmataceae bacterium]|nr:hypothetical protein [Gemmataceae bacterium]
MDHPDWAAFLAAIVAAPDDDTPRLVAADWLDEHGDGDRAAFIRVQVDLARLAAAGLGASPEADRLRAKERAFLGAVSYFHPLWAAEACPELVRVMFREDAANPLTAMHVDGAERLGFSRGFVEVVACPAEDWLTHGAAVRGRQPVREVGLSACTTLDPARWWSMFPVLRGLRRVTVDVPDRPTGGTWGLVWLRDQLPGVAISAGPAAEARRDDRR